jgi:hypothetical protein
MSLAPALVSLGLGLAAAGMYAYIHKKVEEMPETADSFKHRMRHKFDQPYGLCCRYVDNNGTSHLALRCAICFKIVNGIESNQSFEDFIRSDDYTDIFKVRAAWFARKGTKNWDLYEQWKDTHYPVRIPEPRTRA